MCGIAGVLDFSSASPESGSVERMLGRLIHRGPDDEGRAALGPLTFGQRRLSILDPSPAGHQPMRSRDGRFWLVHNGEIYNFLELATELEALGHRFETATDTEVMLAAYAQWGLDAIARFNGIWAFALWDEAEQRLILSRDRFGVKPLYVAEASGQLAFASEIKALLELSWVSADPEPAAVHDFLRDGIVDHTDQTFFRQVRRVPAAHSLVVDAKGPRLVRYWGPPPLSDDASSRPDARDDSLVEEFRELLIDAVALQLRSDVPLGSCLSGGIDSSSIVSVAAALRRGELRSSWSKRRDRDAAPQLAFFAEFREEGIDERPYVDAVVDRVGITLRTTTPNAPDLLETIETIVRAQDEPFGSTSIVAQYFVMKLAHEAGVKVLLDGQGADEVLAGYPPYRAMGVAGTLRGSDGPSRRAALRTLIGRRVPILPTLGRLVLDGASVPWPLRRNRMPDRWIGDVARRAGELDPSLDVPNGTVLARNLWRQIASENLPALLRYEDRNSMAFGIEARVPFLDHRLVEAGLMLPDRLKIRPGEQKTALRHAMDGVVPRLILDRRDKVAFQTPQRRWLVEGASVMDSLAVRSRAEAGGFVALGGLRRTRDEFAAGRLGDMHLWRVMTLELWLRTCERRADNASVPRW